MTHCHLNKTIPCIYITLNTLEVFYLKHSGENTNVIKLQKADDHPWTTSDINFKSDNKDMLSSSLDTFTDDQPGKEWIMCGFWW